MLKLTLSPDLSTRESVMVAAGRAQFTVTDPLTGRECYVKIECKRKQAGGGYERGTVALDEATHVFISEKGYGTSRIGTYYPPKPGYTEGRLFPADGVREDAPHIEALYAIAAVVNTGTADPAVAVESRCGMCGIRLEDKESIRRGIGPDCAGKPTGTRLLHVMNAKQASGQMVITRTSTHSPVEHADEMVAAAQAKVDQAKAALAEATSQLSLAQEHRAEVLEAEEDALIPNPY